MNELAPFIAKLSPGGVGIWVLVVYFAFKAVQEWRETRKLSAEDRLARRDGYAKQVESLQLENRQLRGDIVAVEVRHDEYRKACQAETDRLLQMIREAQDEIVGLKRARTAESIAALDAIPAEFVPADTAAAAVRARHILEDKSDG